MNVAIIGTGYVGLTTGVALAYLGNRVACVDVDESKVEALRRGKAPIFEPHLEELMALAKDELVFTSDYAQAIPNADIVFIAVGTPSGAGGNPDLRYLQAAAHDVGRHLGKGCTVVINKSTVPIGSGSWGESLVADACSKQQGGSSNGRFAVASNPEFLREGSGLHDTLYPDRIVVGSESSRALEMLLQLYRPIVEQTFAAPNFLPRPDGLAAVPVITADLASAELIKYAANAFLALKISYINEIAQLAEKVGAYITQVARGIGLDSRIGARFLQAGIGWGGSCFGKDTAALVATAQEYGLSMPIVRAARDMNQMQRGRVVEKLLAELKILKGKTIALLGLAFKPQTDDLRDAPALDIARQLLQRGVKVKAHDPIAMARASREHPDLALVYCGTAEEAVAESDGVVLATEWSEYRKLDWETLRGSMRHPFVLDGRNFLDRARLVKAGYHYAGFGRGLDSNETARRRVAGGLQ
jgi:UDPglucose 6-dehydrogenase